MENAPVISLNGNSAYPDVNPEIWQRCLKWMEEVNVPVMFANSPRKGIDRYFTARENPMYPMLLSLHHHENLASLQNTQRTIDQTAIKNDSISWQQRHVIEPVWSAVYQLASRFRSAAPRPFDKPDTRIQNAPFMHLEAYRLTPESRNKYNTWLNEYGANIFIPLYLKQPGTRGYDCYQFTGLQLLNDTREDNYPDYLTIIYFENPEAFAKYEKSPELATFQKTLRQVFPLGLSYRWYIQYSLYQSLRR
jgi:hypothetical protein